MRPDLLGTETFVGCSRVQAQASQQRVAGLCFWPAGTSRSWRSRWGLSWSGACVSSSSSSECESLTVYTTRLLFAHQRCVQGLAGAGGRQTAWAALLYPGGKFLSDFSDTDSQMPDLASPSDWGFAACLFSLPPSCFFPLLSGFQAPLGFQGFPATPRCNVPAVVLSASSLCWCQMAQNMEWRARDQ